HRDHPPRGPVSEEDDPYGDSTSPDGLAPVCHVQEIRILPERNYDAVKRAVYLYGGVQTSLYLPSENRVSDEDVCYKGSEEPNHDAVIIGWDDNYPKEKFASNPESDGAFLCVNSWGENFGDGGFPPRGQLDRGAGLLLRHRMADNFDRI
ncbi:MAG: C1 family peptidase, partial [Clostridium sp.]